MFRKHLIYLNNERLLSVIWRNGKTLEAQSFPVDVGGQTAFAQYAKRWSRLRVYFLVDLIEEDFRLDTIPHVRGGDRRELLERKLNQLFRGTPFRHAIVLDREAAGRRDDRVLYTSVTNPELLTPWLEILESVRAPLVGIYSAPLLSARLLKPLGQTAKHALLVTLQQGNHLRQSYTHLGKTKFSRMTPLGGHFAQHPMAAITEEVRKTWDYLESLRYFESGESLHVCVLVGAAEFNGAVDTLPSQPGLEYEFFDIAKAAKNIGLTQPLLNSHGEWLLLHLLGRIAPHNHFARKDLTHRSLVWRVKQTAYAAGAGALLIGAALSSANFLDGKITADRIKQIQDETIRVEQERQQIVRGLPVGSVAPDVMSNTVNFYNQTIKDSPDFSREMIALSRTMARFSEVELLNLVWTTTPDPNKPVSGLSELGLDTSQSSPSNESGATSDADRINLPVDGRLYQILMLSGKLNGVGGDQRKALDYLAQFKRAIEVDIGAKVKVLEQPLDTRANVSLRGSAQAKLETSDAHFALKIVLSGQRQ